MFLTVLLRFLKLLFELSHLFRRYVIWSGSPLPGLFQCLFAESKGFVSLSFRLPSSLNLRHSVVLWVTNGLPTALQHLQNLSVRPFLEVPFAGPPPCVCFHFLGTRSPADLAVAAALAMLARAASCLFTPRKWEVWQDVTRWYSKWVPSLCVRDIPELCNCNNPKDVTQQAFINF